MDLALVVKRCRLAALTVVSVLVLSYSNTTNDSSTDILSSLKHPGLVTRFANTEVTASNDFHVSKAVFLPLPANDDTVSQPVKAWNIGRARAFSAPHEVAIW